MKEFLKKVFYLVSIIMALFLSKIFYRAKKFKVSCDINVDPLDVESTCQTKYVNYGNREMMDFRAGAFLGDLTINMSKMEFPKKQYDMTLVIDHGKIVLILPENINCIITTLQSENNIQDERKIIDNEQSDCLLAINLKAHFGKLVLSN